ncbi:hypothetical protein ABTM96_19885, partial [Acinetobacter baumannii]
AGGSAVFSRADTSAKSARVGSVIGVVAGVSNGKFNVRGDNDPFALVGTTSAGTTTFSYWTTSTGDCTDPGNDNGNFQYVCYFRPDRQK